VIFLLNKFQNAVNPIDNMIEYFQHNPRIGGIFCDKESKDKFFGTCVEYCCGANVCES